MKKYIMAMLALLMLMSFASCEDDMLEYDGRKVADDVRSGIREAERGAERAARDMTDGTFADPDNNYNVDDYNPYGPEAK